MFTHRHPSIDLNGKWKFIPDPMQRCRRQKWWKNPSKPNALFPSWDAEGMWEITVPGTWKTQIDELKWYDGHAVYFREFKAPRLSTDQEAFLAFDGIIYASEIMLNGHRLTRHEWGYSAFQVRVTDILQENNELFVLVDNHLSPERVPGEIFDWNNDGGIVNGVKLVLTPAVHVSNFRTSTQLNGDGAVLRFEIELEARDAAAREEVLITIPELGVKTTVDARVGETACGTIKIPLNKIRLWSPESPKLYLTEFMTRHETISDEIGYREIRAKGADILLNGKPIRLYGVCVHSEFPGTGRTATPEGIEQLVRTVKDLGLNFLRCAHYPYSDIFARAMDRAGLLWWQEVPAYWQFTVREDKMARLVCGMLEETIRRDWNRAGLIIWSVSNECCWTNPEDGQENNIAYWTKAVETVRRLDPNRLVSCAEAQNIVSTASLWSPGNNDAFAGAAATWDTHLPMHEDAFYHLFDILSANLYVSEPGEEETLYPRFVKLFARYNKPLIVSEFGSISLRGAKVPPHQLGSEERHARMIERAYAMFAQLPEIKGYSPWVLVDGRAPIHWRWYNQGKGLYRHGFLDENWQPKQAYAALGQGVARLKNLWQESPAVINGHSTGNGQAPRKASHQNEAIAISAQ
jgi:beta-glucuronidase